MRPAGKFCSSWVEPRAVFTLGTLKNANGATRAPGYRLFSTYIRLSHMYIYVCTCGYTSRDWVRKTKQEKIVSFLGITIKVKIVLLYVLYSMRRCCARIPFKKIQPVKKMESYYCYTCRDITERPYLISVSIKKFSHNFQSLQKKSFILFVTFIFKSTGSIYYIRRNLNLKILWRHFFTTWNFCHLIKSWI